MSVGGISRISAFSLSCWGSWERISVRAGATLLTSCLLMQMHSDSGFERMSELHTHHLMLTIAQLRRWQVWCHGTKWEGEKTKNGCSVSGGQEQGRSRRVHASSVWVCVNIATISEIKWTPTSLAASLPPAAVPPSSRIGLLRHLQRVIKGPHPAKR